MMDKQSQAIELQGIFYKSYTTYWEETEAIKAYLESLIPASIATVPYQCCPVCNGIGQVLADGMTSLAYQPCKACLGNMIIPMHVLKEK